MSKSPNNILNNLAENISKKDNKINQVVKTAKTSNTKIKNQNLVNKSQKTLIRKEGTMKDSLTALDISTKINYSKRNEPSSIKNNNNAVKQNNKNTIHQSSLETTPTINKSIENNIFNSNIYNTNSENIYNLGTKIKNIKQKMFNYQKFVINEKISGRIITESEYEDTLKNDNIISDKTSSDIIECSSNESTINKINVDILNKIIRCRYFCIIFKLPSFCLPDQVIFRPVIAGLRIRL